ncbi:succinyldiaminopimelate aminotransferase [Branchiibius hedensis]|uniref:Succinyldiaminopimelate aminotransferase apoenzyme n=1 Tax=Branchiibius hedensis TaxID=672460 RepID=A0A2Y9BTV2_9MICO|nr:pyridoxal phosphate-dependent aminotransferase [Branchiibius hedensis]PWJ25849.1 succinyldiaminopimelate aminotransferase [Branchiibius hedensis]SSA34662.1 succinyldiaminopimelate aminotransferase apoenzyme [Branchiibius hedensis]
MTNRRPPIAPTLAVFGSTIFGEMSALAAQVGAVNLGQGFPDTDGPAEVLQAAQDAIADGYNQYPPALGYPVLREAIASHQQRHYDLDIDPQTQVLVTVGATEAIASAVLALCEPGDEVVTFEPYYDSYAACIALAGATRRTVPLRFPDFAVDEDALRAAFTGRTRLVLLNTPHNPTGKVFSRDELTLIAALAAEYDAYVVTDEVYEHLTFDGARHLPFAALPGTGQRTITISSAGKTFSTTGWKVGWLTGPAELVSACRTVKQFLTYVGSGPFQPAIALGLDTQDDYVTRFAQDLGRKRDLLSAGLTAAGFEVARSNGTYFVIADAAPLGVTDAMDFCWQLPRTHGVAAIPVSAFCDDKDAARTLVRFAFCKKDEVLAEAVARLTRA